MPTKITLGILMGLPASGKTTLCNHILAKSKLNQDKTKAQVIILSFDHFVPLSLQSQLVNLAQIEDSQEDPKYNATKLIRQNFLKLVENLIAKFQKDESGSELWSSPELINDMDSFQNEIKEFINPTTWVEKLKSILLTVPTLELGNGKVDSDSLIFLVDDNNYYKSMRNDYYSICKRQKIGFTILYTNTPAETCQKRNLLRESDADGPVPPEAITKMNQKLEPPELSENLADSYCFNVIDANDPGTIDIVYNVLLQSLDSPIDVEPPPDRSEERRICAENEIHQADLVLRKWIHLEISKVAMFDRSKLKQVKEQLSKKKEDLLSALRAGQLQLSSKVGDEYEFSQEILGEARKK